MHLVKIQGLRILFLVTGVLLNTGVFAETPSIDSDISPVLKEASREYDKGNFRSALKHFERAYEESSLRTPIIPKIYECHVRLGQADRGMQFLLSAIKDQPFDAETRLFLADKYQGLGKYEFALEQLDYVMRLVPKDHRALYKRALVEIAQGKCEDAVATLNNYIDRAKPSSHEPYLRRAQCSLKLNKPELAVASVKRAYEIKAFDIETLVSYVEILQALGKHAEAESFGKQCTDVDPQFSKCWIQRGDLAVTLKKFAPAIEYYDTASKLVPGDNGVRTKLASAYLSNNQPAEADMQFGRVLKANPEDREMLHIWVPSLLQRENFGKAADVLKIFHSRRPADFWGASEYARIMSFVGMADEAAEIMKTHVRASRTDIARMYLAFYQYQTNQFSRAEDTLDDVKDAAMPAQFDLGLVFWKAKRPDKAIKTWSKIKQENALWIKAQYNVALLEYRAGKSGPALERLKALNPPQTLQEPITKLIAHLSSDRREPAEAKTDDGFKVFSEWEFPQ